MIQRVTFNRRCAISSRAARFCIMSPPCYPARMAYSPEQQAGYVEAEQARSLGIPEEGRQAFRAQRQSAKRRGIPFLFELTDWWAWWQLDGRWDRRGMGGDALVMARHGDVGPYSLDNVMCITHAENMAQISTETRSAGGFKRWATMKARGQECHLAVRGEGHPKSRAVITPNGTYGSAALAAEANGVTRQCASGWARDRRKGWRYADDDGAPPPRPYSNGRL